MGVILEGETLGQKHRCYNKLVAESTANKELKQIQKINYDDPDIDNLFKIDLASNRKDVEYIIEVLKCEDMLYVSRALKISVWLITDKEYAHIINPDYLYTQLLPQMTSKAGHKLILCIRLNLKDEKRVEQFYKYYEAKKDLKIAFKWLPNCSVAFIEKNVEKYTEELPTDLKLRLFERSITILEICARIMNEYETRHLLSKSMFLLNTDAERFLRIVNSQETYCIPRFRAKATQLIMKSNPNLILNNFEKFSTKIHIPTFTKCLKREDIKDFLIKHFQNENLVKSWFNFDNMKYFLQRMASEGRVEFIKRVCIEKTDISQGEGSVVEPYEFEEYFPCALESASQSNNSNIYRWYKFFPFETAFTDLKKLIRMESNPTERNAMFAVLISCTRRNPQNLQTVLLYYRDKHINEPFKFKIHFVNMILSSSYSHQFDAMTWSILNDIFCSLEVYSEKENNVQSCLKHIIIYQVVHDEKVPDIVEKKFEFDSLKSFQSKLSNEEKDKVFNYLFRLMLTKIENLELVSESALPKVIQHIVSALNLLKDWNKDILSYDVILEKIREVLKLKVNNSWNEDLAVIYNANKSWRKNMFKESLSLCPSQETCINALKHGPQILVESQETICLTDSMLHSRLLGKLRMYWPHSLAKTFEDTFRKHLNSQSQQKISVRGLCVLLPQKQLAELLNNYTPEDTKIYWGQINETTLGIQKSLAKYMYLARPQPTVHTVLKYAKGDYLQFVLPSVHSILFNLSSSRSLENIPTILDAPVSLQKHGFKIAFAKLKTDKLLKTCLDAWKSSKNASIRATIFKLVFDLLCQEQDEDKMKEVWHAMSSFIDTLTADENRNVYLTLGLAKNVPIPVKAAYCMKSYRFLKSLPPKVKCNKFSESVLSSTMDIMEFIDLDFMSEALFDSFESKFTKTFYSLADVISACLLSAKTEATQTQRYEQIFVPVFKKYLALKDAENDDKNKHYLKYNFHILMKRILEDVMNVVLEMDMITPVKLFKDIHTYLEQNLSGEDYFVLISRCKLAAEYMKLINKYRLTVVTEGRYDTKGNAIQSKWNILYLEAASDFGEVCVQVLNEQTAKHFPSICKLVAQAIDDLCDYFFFTNKVKLALLQSIQEQTDTVEGHLMVFELLPSYALTPKDQEVKSKICKTLASHPSAEVRMHYQQKLRTMEMSSSP